MNVIIQYCSMACLIALSFCDSNTTLDDDEFPSVEAFTVMNEVTEDILDASTVAGDLSISEEQLFEMPPPLLDFETTSPPPQRSSSHQLDTFDDSQISSNFSTKPLVTTPAASFPSPINSFNTMMNKAKVASTICSHFLHNSVTFELMRLFFRRTKIVM
ncbi:unnamed protein product [Toxocara canis]|uniref:Secreted protein n=1 Tax=Toxocara canis TaxID=6265 RepID=A0A183VA90_TOXCA|nr:unnamed protein product [Toxocara canis]